MFNALFCRNSGTFDCATVSLECQTGRAYIDLVLDVRGQEYNSAKVNTQVDRRMHRNKHFETQK